MQGVTTSHHRHRRAAPAIVLASAVAAGCAQIAGLGGFKDAPDAGTGAGTSSSAGGTGGSSSAGGCMAGSGGAGGSCASVGCPPVQIVAATATQDITGFALDVTPLNAATSVFWLDRGSGADDGGVYRTPNIPEATCMTVTVAPKLCGPRAIITDGFTEFWVVENPPGCPAGSGGQVWSASLDLKNVTPLFQGEQRPIAVAVWFGSLYWLNAGDDTVRSGATSGMGTPTTLTTQVAAPTAIATDGTWVYWTQTGSPPAVGHVKPDMTMAGLMTTTVGTPTRLALDFQVPAWVPYWTDPAMKSVSYLKNGAVQQLIGGSAPSGIAIAGGNAYWADAVDGSIHATPLSGGTDVLIAQHQDAPTAVAVDTKSVFWLTTSGGRGTGIWRAPR